MATTTSIRQKEFKQNPSSLTKTTKTMAVHYAQEEIINGGAHEVGILVYDGTEEESQQTASERLDGEGNLIQSISTLTNEFAECDQSYFNNNNSNNPKSRTISNSNMHKELSPSSRAAGKAGRSIRGANQYKKDVLDNVFEKVEANMCSNQEELNDTEKRMITMNPMACNDVIDEEDDDFDEIVSDVLAIVKNPTPEFRIFPSDIDSLTNSLPPRTPTLGEPEMPKPEFITEKRKKTKKRNGSKKNREGDTADCVSADAQSVTTNSTATNSEDRDRQAAAATTTGTGEEEQIQPKQTYLNSLFGYFNKTNKIMTSPRSKENRIPADNDEDDGVVQVDSGDTDSSPITLHSLVPYDQQPDALDNFFTKVEDAVCRSDQDGSDNNMPDPRNQKRMQLHPNLRCQDVDCRDESDNLSQNENKPKVLDSPPGFRSHMTASQLHFFRESSLLDTTKSSDDPVEIVLTTEGERQNKLEKIRQKKRDIEAQVQSSCREPGVLIPRGYLQKDRLPSSSVELSHQEALEKRKIFQRHMILFVAMAMVTAAIALLCVSFFWKNWV